jgi:hypothetical protein
VPARGLDELIVRENPGWPIVEGWIGESKRPVEVLPADRARAKRALLALQVTSRSILGALALGCAGVLVDHGWLRLLGCGSDRMTGSLLSWNGLDGPAPESALQGALLVAHDAVGGFFAINGDAAPDRRGMVSYFAPDSLTWENLGVGHADFVNWALTGDLDNFYETVRWAGWEDEVRKLSPDRGFSIDPCLWAKGPPLEERSRRDVPMEELWGLNNEMASRLGPPRT